MKIRFFTAEFRYACSFVNWMTSMSGGTCADSAQSACCTARITAVHRTRGRESNPLLVRLAPGRSRQRHNFLDSLVRCQSEPVEVSPAGVSGAKRVLHLPETEAGSPVRKQADACKR